MPNVDATAYAVLVLPVLGLPNIEKFTTLLSIAAAGFSPFLIFLTTEFNLLVTSMMISTKACDGTKSSKYSNGGMCIFISSSHLIGKIKSPFLHFFRKLATESLDLLL